MKKILVLMLMLMLCVNVSAEESFETAGDLFQYWEGNDAYPDYVCGMWSTDGGYYNLTIAVQNTEEGNAGKEEILALVENDATVTFVYGENSYNYLRRVQRELEPYFGEETGLVSSGVDVMNSRITIGFLEEKFGTPENIALMDELREKYGDVFTVEVGAIVYTLEEKLSDVAIVNFSEKSVKDYTVFWIIGSLLLLLFAVAVLRRRVAVTPEGDTATDVSLTKREVENMVKNADVEYPTELDDKILNKINDR